MPPQQRERLLDPAGDGVDFRAHARLLRDARGDGKGGA
jgi:hypothetical protein